MTTRRKILTHTEDIYTNDLPISKLIERLQALTEDALVNASEDAIHINVYRDETDGELARRIAREQEVSNKHEEQQREYYLKLKAKYEGS